MSETTPITDYEIVSSGETADGITVGPGGTLEVQAGGAGAGFIYRTSFL